MLTYKEHLLSTLAEEASELAQACNKTLRFTEVETLEVVIPPDDPAMPTALQNIVTEFNDLIAVVEMLQEAGVLPQSIYSPTLNVRKRHKMMGYWYRIDQLATTDRPRPAYHLPPN